MEKVIIIGGGIAGLTAAHYLQKAGISFKLFECNAQVGGRMMTTNKDGYLLDHGFQVFLPEYPEAQAILDYDKLNLKPFLPGALLLMPTGKIDRIGDPLRDMSSLIPTLLSKAGSIQDKLLILKLRNSVLGKKDIELFNSTETTTLEKLQKFGFSDQMINHFFKPFFAGIFLEKNIQTSHRIFDFIFKMFAKKGAAIPNKGMQQIPLQLARNLEKGSILLNTSVKRIEENKVILANGNEQEAERIIIATEATNLVSNFFPNTNTNFQSTTHLHFKAAKAPFLKPIIALNTRAGGLVNNICVMDQVAPGYNSNEGVLISVSGIGKNSISDQDFVSGAKKELKPWFGAEVDAWELINIRQVEYALPSQLSAKNELEEKDYKLNEKLYCCGDHLLNGSINGAMKSGRVVAQSIIASNKNINVKSLR